jgi:hypothetical protein
MFCNFGGPVCSTNDGSADTRERAYIKFGTFGLCGWDKLGKAHVYSSFGKSDKLELMNRD